MPVPPEVTGVWRRERITAPGGYLDDTTRVCWVQSLSWYGDIRVRADAPRRPGATSFADYSDAELVELARSQGFAGQLTVTPQMCAWRRDLDYQPPGPVPDEGTWTIDGDVLVEGGIHAEYEEIWRLEPESGGLRAAFAREGGPGLLVIAGDHFLMMRGRGAPLAGESLAALVEAELAAGRRSAAEDLLSMPIAYGRIGERWRVSLSTLPWLEGRSLWNAPPELDGGRLRLPEGETWSLLEADAPPDRLAALFALATTEDEPL